MQRLNLRLHVSLLLAEALLYRPKALPPGIVLTPACMRPIHCMVVMILLILLLCGRRFRPCETSPAGIASARSYGCVDDKDNVSSCMPKASTEKTDEAHDSVKS